MLGQTITVTVNAVAKTLNLINQDSYSGEYFLREASGSYSMKVRHTFDKPDSKGRRAERHFVDLSYTVFPDAQGLGGKTRRAYLTLVHLEEDDAAAVVHLQQALQGFMTVATATKVVGRES